MRNLKVSVRAFCVLPFVTGAIDFTRGAGFLKSAGVPLSEELVSNAILDSQVRFWGAIWLGYGLVLWSSASRLERDPGTFRLLCGILALSGLGRILSFVRCGSPGAPLTAAIAIETLGAAGFAVWHAALLRDAEPS